MKEAHLILLFDGTGRHADEKTQSNCVKINHCLETGEVESGYFQETNYYSGIGTSEPSFLQRTLSQVRGHGAQERLMQGYLDVCEFANNHRDADIKLSIAGFSRGFVIGLVLQKMVHKAGILDFEKIAAERGQNELSEEDKAELARYVFEELYVSELKPSDPKVQHFRSEHSFDSIPEFHLFAFDPVATFANHPNYKPFRLVTDVEGEEHLLHSPKLPRSTASYTEIIALHEKRGTFNVLRVDTPEHYEIDKTTMYMEGDHSSIGGGSHLREGLADVAGIEMLKQMVEKAAIAVDHNKVEELFDPDLTICPDNKFGSMTFLSECFFYAATRTFSKLRLRELTPATDELHESVFVRQGQEVDELGMQGST